MKTTKSWWKPLLTAFLIGLCPVCFLGGCLFGMTKTISRSGLVTITDGLVTRHFIQTSRTVHLALIDGSNETPSSIVVDFKDADTGSMITSETVGVEPNRHGVGMFEFDFPTDADNSSHKHITAVVRSHHN